MSDKIEKSTDLDAPVARVWKALTDHDEFGRWFRAKLESPFVPGETTRGHITYPGYEHVKPALNVVAMEPERLFAFTWHPYAVDPDVDYTDEPHTLVEFRLAPRNGGTRLTVTESGFDKVPKERRFEAFRMNEKGWTLQVKNIAEHVDHAA